MEYSEKLKIIRERLFLSQADFAKELGVSFASVNRWEQGHFQPNYKAKKAINDICVKNDIKFEDK